MFVNRVSGTNSTIIEGAPILINFNTAFRQGIQLNLDIVSFLAPGQLFEPLQFVVWHTPPPHRRRAQKAPLALRMSLGSAEQRVAGLPLPTWCSRATVALAAGKGYNLEEMYNCGSGLISGKYRIEVTASLLQYPWNLVAI